MSDQFISRITSQCFPPDSDGYMTVESFDPSDRRSSLEVIRCRSESGKSEFREEVARIRALRAKDPEMGTTVVRLMQNGEFEEEREEIA